jgi:hypothetical protein
LYSIDIDDHIHLAMIAAVISGEMGATLSGQVRRPAPAAAPVTISATFVRLRIDLRGAEREVVRVCTDVLQPAFVACWLT